MFSYIFLFICIQVLIFNAEIIQGSGVVSGQGGKSGGEDGASGDASHEGVQSEDDDMYSQYADLYDDAGLHVRGQDGQWENVNKMEREQRVEIAKDEIEKAKKEGRKTGIVSQSADAKQK